MIKLEGFRVFSSGKCTSVRFEPVRVFSKRNGERVRCNFVTNASGLGVSSRRTTLSGTYCAAIGLVARLDLRDIALSYCNFRNGSRFEFLVASLGFGSEALSWNFSIRRFGFGSSVKCWAKETLGCDPFSRFGACGRRPSESADPGGSAGWAFYRRWYRGHCRKKLYGGRGLRLVGGPHMPILVFQIGGFTVRK